MQGGLAPLHSPTAASTWPAACSSRAADEWGLDDVDVLSLLAGVSCDDQGARHTKRIVAALDGAVVDDSASLDDVCGTNPDVAAAVHAYLADVGWSPLEGSDVSSPTLADQPDVVVDLHQRPLAQSPTASTVEGETEALRTRVPDADRARFDDLLADARLTYQLRDDDNAVTYGRPLSIIRKTMLEIGRRLLDRGAVGDLTDVFETDPSEIVSLLTSGTGPDAAELHDRAQRRIEQSTLDPPIQLGERPQTPPGPLLPEHMAQVAAIAERSLVRSAATAPGRPGPRGPRRHGRGARHRTQSPRPPPPNPTRRASTPPRRANPVALPPPPRHR